MTAHRDKNVQEKGGHAMMNTYQILTLLIMFCGVLISLIDFIRKIIKERKREKYNSRNNKK